MTVEIRRTTGGSDIAAGVKMLRLRRIVETGITIAAVRMTQTRAAMDSDRRGLRIRSASKPRIHCAESGIHRSQLMLAAQVKATILKWKRPRRISQAGPRLTPLRGVIENDVGKQILTRRMLENTGRETIRLPIDGEMVEIEVDEEIGP